MFSNLVTSNGCLGRMPYPSSRQRADVATGLETTWTTETDPSIVSPYTSSSARWEQTARNMLWPYLRLAYCLCD
jgi:hypothetical protein